MLCSARYGFAGWAWLCMSRARAGLVFLTLPPSFLFFLFRFPFSFFLLRLRLFPFIFFFSVYPFHLFLFFLHLVGTIFSLFFCSSHVPFLYLLFLLSPSSSDIKPGRKASSAALPPREREPGPRPQRQRDSWEVHGGGAEREAGPCNATPRCSPPKETKRKKEIVSLINAIAQKNINNPKRKRKKLCRISTK